MYMNGYASVYHGTCGNIFELSGKNPEGRKRIMIAV